MRPGLYAGARIRAVERARAAAPCRTRRILTASSLEQVFEE